MYAKEILEKNLESLVRQSEILSRKILLFEDDDSPQGVDQYSKLLNNQTKISRAIRDVVSLLRDPKRRIISPGVRGRNELAKMMERLAEIEKEEIASNKVVLTTIKDMYGFGFHGHMTPNYKERGLFDKVKWDAIAKRVSKGEARRRVSKSKVRAILRTGRIRKGLIFARK
jgi:hypothetical protein